MEATASGYADTVELLITMGADVNAKDKGGDTPLKIATRGGHTRIQEMLRAAGASEDEDEED